MEKQRLEQILQKYEKWNRQGLKTTLEIVDWKQGKDYDLIFADSQEFWDIYPVSHYHYGSELYLIYKPKSIVKKVSNVEYGDGPTYPKKTYTDTTLEEKEEGVIIKYQWNLPDGENGNKIKEYRWVAIIKQGEKEPEYEIEEIKH